MTEQMETFAAAILASYLRTEDAERPIDIKTARAEFKGFCKAADALGMVHTPDHLVMIVLEATRAAGPRPQWLFTSRNEAVRAWDRQVIAAIQHEMES